MNQQRVRRLSAETAQGKMGGTSYRPKNRTQPILKLSEAWAEQVSDSNYVTTATRFMHGLPRALTHKIVTDIPA